MAFVHPFAIISVVFLEGEAVNVCVLSLNRISLYSPAELEYFPNKLYNFL